MFIQNLVHKENSSHIDISLILTLEIPEWLVSYSAITEKRKKVKGVDATNSSMNGIGDHEVIVVSNKYFVKFLIIQHKHGHHKMTKRK